MSGAGTLLCLALVSCGLVFVFWFAELFISYHAGTPRTKKRWARRAHEYPVDSAVARRCANCRHWMIPTQTRCPECGDERRRTEA